ncbi:MAG: tetraacyldisaccharide 4'-kinase [Rikenellaceae bacterium]|nr:tetraacyldisaccharide 4'-kinase [Rikenellaceae bacterium]
MMKFLLKLISYLYRLVITIRHWLFDVGLLKSEKFDIPIICVGNITVGGTGKTPAAEMIIDYMRSFYHVALLSRGYGRRTSGYIEVEKNSSYRDVGDEPLQVKLKFPDTLVVVCENRVEAIKRIQREHPDVNLIIMDDGFQHRHVEARINVVVVDSTRPFASDDYLPAGTLRDKIDALSRAHYFLVTKCDSNMSQLDQRLWRKDLQKIAYQRVYFTRVVPSDAVPLHNVGARLDVGDSVVLMSGIGNPKVFVSSMKERYNVLKSFTFPDHHKYSVEDLNKVTEFMEQHPQAKLLITEKDAVKLRRSRRVPELLRQRMFYMPVVVDFLDGSDEDFLGTLKNDLDGKVHLGDLSIGGAKSSHN